MNKNFKINVNFLSVLVPIPVLVHVPVPVLAYVPVPCSFCACSVPVLSRLVLRRTVNQLKSQNIIVFGLSI
jgi:hypothetical protein